MSNSDFYDRVAAIRQQIEDAFDSRYPGRLTKEEGGFYKVDGADVPVIFDRWGGAQVTVRVGYHRRNPLRSKRDGTFPYVDEVVGRMVGWVEGARRSEQIRQQNERDHHAAVEFLQSLGLAEVHYVMPLEQRPGFSWHVSTNGVITAELRFVPGKLEDFRKLLEIFPKGNQ